MTRTSLCGRGIMRTLTGRRRCAAAARVGGGLHRTDVAADHDRHVAAADLLLADQRDVRCLDHCVGRLDRADQAPRLDHAERDHLGIRHWSVLSL
jgi:hypothetical protein